MNTTSAPSRRDVQISEWRTLRKNTLRGFFTITLPSGMVVHGCMLHTKDDGERWIGFPRREYELQGERKFAPIITFIDRETEHRFRDAVLAALDHDKPWGEVQR